MSVVAAYALDDLVAAGGGPCEPDRGHCRLGAAVDESNHLHAGEGGDDFLGQHRLGFGRRAERSPPADGLGERRHHPFVGMSDDHRAVGADVVDVPVAIDVDQEAALGLLDEDRRSPNPLECPDGRGVHRHQSRSAITIHRPARRSGGYNACRPWSSL